MSTQSPQKDNKEDNQEDNQNKTNVLKIIGYVFLGIIGAIFLIFIGGKLYKESVKRDIKKIEQYPRVFQTIGPSPNKP